MEKGGACAGAGFSVPHPDAGITRKAIIQKYNNRLSCKRKEFTKKAYNKQVTLKIINITQFHITIIFNMAQVFFYFFTIRLLSDKKNRFASDTEQIGFAINN
jgi:hypothetical protein